MAVTLRLMRLGKRHKPFYRIVAIDKRKKRNSRYIDNIGFYNPIIEPSQIEINKERFTYWVGQGAVISEGLAKILKYSQSKESKGV